MKNYVIIVVLYVKSIYYQKENIIKLDTLSCQTCFWLVCLWPCVCFKRKSQNYIHHISYIMQLTWQLYLLFSFNILLQSCISLYTDD
jgi:hypothetical protein